MALRSDVLHAVLGSVEVAQTMIGRSTTLVGCGAHTEDALATALRDATEALSVLATVVDRELVRRKTLGPAA